MKKYLSLLLSFVMLFCSFTSLIVQAETEEVWYSYNSLNALKNSDFEVNTDSWEFYSKADTYTAEVSKTQAYSGLSSLYLSSTKQLYAYQNIPVAEGDKLIAIVYCNPEKLPSSGYSFITIETWGDEKTDSKTKNVRPSTGKWSYITTEINVPANTTYAQFKIGLATGGNAYFDDIVLMHFPKDRSWEYTQEQRAAFKKNDCTIKTDELFYYKEWEGGYANITPNSTIKTNYADGSLKAYITKKDGTVVTEQTFAVENTKFDFKTKDLNPYYGEPFIVHADVYDKDGKLVSESKHQIMYYARPTHIDENANWITEEGKPLDVIIGTNAGHDEAMVDYMVSAGITVTTLGYSLDATKLLDQLNLVWSRGMYAIVALYSNSNPCGNYPVQLIDAIKAVKDHPAVFAYAVQDEPNADYFDTVYALQNSYQLIRDIDKDHPVYICDSNINYRNVGSYEATCADFFCVDTYPGWTGVYTALVGSFMKSLANFQREHHNKPVTMYTQCFEFRGFIPNAAKTRHMVYQTLFAGVRYPSYYTIPDIMAIEGFPEGIAYFTNTDLPIVYDLFSTDKYEILAYDINGNDNMWSYDSSLAWYYVFRENNDTYVAAINLSDTDEKQVVIPNIKGVQGNPIPINDATGSTISLNGETITLKLAPAGCVLYKYTPESQFTLKSSNGYKVASPLGFGETIAEYIPKEGETSNPRIIIAEYEIQNGAEVLKKVSITDSLKSETGSYKAIANVEKADLTKKYKISAFVFERNTLKPLAKTVTVKN